MTPEPLSSTEPEPQGLSAFSRLTGVFFEPTKTFEDIAARPGWVLPMILMIVAGLAFSTAMGSRIGWDRMVDQQTQARLAAASPDQRPQMEKGIEMQKKFTPIGAYVFSVVGPPLTALLCSAILLAMVSGIMSAGVKYKQIFSVWCYAAMPTTLIFTALVIVVMYMKPPDDFNIRNPLAFNPAAFLDPTSTSKFLYSLLTALDVFAFWRIFLLAVGLKAAGGKKLSMGGALFAVLLPWGILVLGSSALAGVFG